MFSVLWISISVAFVSFVSIFIYLIWRKKVLKDTLCPIHHVLEVALFSLVLSAVLLFALLQATFLQISAMILSTALSVVIWNLHCQFNPTRSTEWFENWRDFAPNGTQVDFLEAFKASGSYPRDYLSREFFNSIQYDLRRNHPKISNRNEPGLHIDKNRNINLPNFNVVNGLRLTTNQAKFWANSCSIFGTSQSFGEEVPDDLTCASFLQRILNTHSVNVRIVNHSRPGSTLSERVDWFINHTSLEKGNVFIFLFGSNECGWWTKRKGKHGSCKLAKSPLLIIFDHFRKQLKNYYFFHRLLTRRHVNYCVKIAVTESLSAIKKAKKYADFHNFKILFVLQPTLFCSKTNTAYELSKKNQFSHYLSDQIRTAYPKYETFASDTSFVVSITNIFDNLPDSVYLDWVHVNARGHELIAERIFFEAVEFNLFNFADQVL